jgi:hypothetical protein
MVYNIIYLRQGHGGRGFDQNKLVQLLDLANRGNIYSIKTKLNKLFLRI